MIDFHSGEIKDIMPVNLRTPQALAISYAVGQAMARFQEVSESTAALCTD